MHKIYTNKEAGLEAIITEGNGKHPYRAILRDIDANQTVCVWFSTLAICYDKAMEFVGEGTPETHISGDGTDSMPYASGTHSVLGYDGEIQRVDTGVGSQRDSDYKVDR